MVMMGAYALNLVKSAQLFGVCNCSVFVILQCLLLLGVCSLECAVVMCMQFGIWHC